MIPQVTEVCGVKRRSSLREKGMNRYSCLPWKRVKMPATQLVVMVCSKLRLAVLLCWQELVLCCDSSGEAEAAQPLTLCLCRLYGGMNYRRLGGGVGVIKMTHCESHIW